MTIVVVQSQEKQGKGGRLVALVPAEDLWAFQVLCARAGQQVLSVKEESDAS
jgi:hypothetical protein